MTDNTDPVASGDDAGPGALGDDMGSVAPGDDTGPVTQHWLVSGHVQGVGYRLWMQRKASGAGVQGWVRNLRDGRVEAVLAGDAQRLAMLAADARRGPDLAVVDAILVRPWDGAAPSGPFGLRSDADAALGG